MSREKSGFIITTLIIGLLLLTGTISTRYDLHQQKIENYGEKMSDVEPEYGYDTLLLDNNISGNIHGGNRNWVFRDHTFSYLHYEIDASDYSTKNHSISSITFSDDVPEITDEKTTKLDISFGKYLPISLDEYGGDLWTVQSVQTDNETLNEHNLYQYNLIQFNFTHVISNQTINYLDIDKFVENRHVLYSDFWISILSEDQLMVQYSYYMFKGSTTFIHNVTVIDRGTLDFIQTWTFSRNYYRPFISNDKLWLRTPYLSLEGISHGGGTQSIMESLVGYDLSRFAETNEEGLNCSQWEIDQTVFIHYDDFNDPEPFYHGDDHYRSLDSFITDNVLITPYYFYRGFPATSDFIGFQVRTPQERGLMYYYTPNQYYFNLPIGGILVLLGSYFLLKRRVSAN